MVPDSGTAPSATTTIENELTFMCRCRRCAQASSMSNGFSGISNMSAPPLSAAYRAIQPAWRPITSITITRS